MPLTPTLAAAVWMTGAIASFTSMAVAGRAVSGDLDTFEIMLFRSLVGICIVTSVALVTRQTANIRRARLGLHALRNLLHFAGQNLWFFAITLIPLALTAAVLMLETSTTLTAILERIAACEKPAQLWSLTLKAQPDVADNLRGDLVSCGNFDDADLSTAVSRVTTALDALAALS